MLLTKKGEVQLDKNGDELHIGQSVLVMDKVHYKGARGGVSTGVIVGFDRYVIIVLDSNKKMASQGDVSELTKFYEDKDNKSISKHWESDYAERDRRGIGRWSHHSVSSCHVIGCTDRFRKGWLDGTIFKE